MRHTSFKLRLRKKLKSSRESARKLLERASKEALTHTEHMKNEVMSMSRNNYRQAEARTLKRRDELIQDSKQQAHVLSKDIVKNILEQTNTTPVRNRKMKEIS